MGQEKINKSGVVSVGFVGVGRMGGNMARRLHACGYRVTAVYSAKHEEAATLGKELGCAAPERLSQVTEAADVIFTVVTDDAAQLSVFAEEGDSLLTGAKGKIFINCATVSPLVHRVIEERCEKVGAESLEACMASSIPQALAGTLYLMVAGRRETFEKTKTTLEKLSDGGKLLRYIGEAGRAAQVKALVNMVMNINTAGLAEGLGLASALGMDLEMVREIFAQTGAGSRVLITDGEDMQNREHSCFFSAAHAAKDSGIALGLAKELGMELPLAEATKQQYDRMVAAGLGELDKSGIAELTFPGRG